MPNQVNPTPELELTDTGPGAHLLSAFVSVDANLADDTLDHIYDEELAARVHDVVKRASHLADSDITPVYHARVTGADPLFPDLDPNLAPLDLSRITLRYDFTLNAGATMPYPDMHDLRQAVEDALRGELTAPDEEVLCTAILAYDPNLARDSRLSLLVDPGDNVYEVRMSIRTLQDFVHDQLLALVADVRSRVTTASPDELVAIIDARMSTAHFDLPELLFASTRSGLHLASANRTIVPRFAFVEACPECRDGFYHQCGR